MALMRRFKTHNYGAEWGSYQQQSSILGYESTDLTTVSAISQLSLLINPVHTYDLILFSLKTSENEMA